MATHSLSALYLQVYALSCDIVQYSRFSQVSKVNSESRFSASGSRSLFLELPLEIRQLIYDATLGLCLSDQLSLLSTNHQVYEEGYDFIFRRPLTFSSRLRMETFIKSHSTDALGQVRSLGLRLGELAAAAMESYLRNAIMGIPTHLSEHPYILESVAILACVRTMPSLRHFSLLPPRQKNQNPAPRELVQHLLTQIPQHLKYLESLSVSTDLKSLDFLAEMPRLRSLRYSGCSDTDSESATRIFSQMSSLQELSIIGPSPAFLKRQRCSLQKGAIIVLTPDVLSRMPPLKRLTIRDIGPPGNPTFFTKKMLMVIYESHRSTLQSLCLSSKSQPSIETVGMLKAVLMSLPMLSEVSFEWPNVETELIAEHLPPTVQSLTVAVQSTVHAQDMVDGLLSAAIRLPYLREVRFNLVGGAEQLSCGCNNEKAFDEVTRWRTPGWRIT